MWYMLVWLNERDDIVLSLTSEELAEIEASHETHCDAAGDSAPSVLNTN